MVWVVEELLAIPEIAGLLLRDALVALVVLDAVVFVGEEAVVGGAGEVDRGGGGLAGAAVAVAIAAAHVLGEVQVWSLSGFEVSWQVLTNYLNQVSSVSLLVT